MYISNTAAREDLKIEIPGAWPDLRILAAFKDLLPGKDHTQNLSSVKVVFSFASINRLAIYPSQFLCE